MKNASITTIAGDSMGSNVFGDKLTKSLKNEHHVVVCFFIGGKTQCMKGYIKPTVNVLANQIIIHCRTNNLPSKLEKVSLIEH